jgi:hypothetical protein
MIDPVSSEILVPIHKRTRLRWLCNPEMKYKASNRLSVTVGHIAKVFCNTVRDMNRKRNYCTQLEPSESCPIGKSYHVHFTPMTGLMLCGTSSSVPQLLQAVDNTTQTSPASFCVWFFTVSCDGQLDGTVLYNIGALHGGDYGECHHL